MFNPPTLEDLQETRRANEKLVLEALDSKPEWVETELAKTTGLALSHLRAALASLLDQGRVRRLPGTGTRAVYGLADPGLADVPATPLTEDALRIREYLEGRADSALYMSDQLRLTREEVMAALSLLNAHGQITCTFVGSLVIFRLKEQQALDAETAEAAAAAEAAADEESSRPAAKKPAAKAARKTKAAASDDTEATTKPAKKPAAKKASTKAAKTDTAKTNIAKTDTAQPDAADGEKEKAATPAKKATKPAAKKASTKAAAADKADKTEAAVAESASGAAASEAAPKKPAVRKRVKTPAS